MGEMCLLLAGLQLLGFKPLSLLQNQQHVRPSHFVYPDEGAVRGSTRLFGALLQSCLRHNVAPLCYWVSRGTQAPKLVYLLAQVTCVNTFNTAFIALPRCQEKPQCYLEYVL